jgi:hypothetical protein
MNGSKIIWESTAIDDVSRSARTTIVIFRVTEKTKIQFCRKPMRRELASVFLPSVNS